MYPGPGSPFRGMGPNRMGPGFMRQGPGHFGNSPMRPTGPTRSQMNPMMRSGQPIKQGGFLAKLFGKGNGPGMQNLRGAATPTGGGLLRSLANPGSINGFLNNTQQVLKTAQQVGPMIQQYGPIMKNLPAMWKLYRGFKDLPEQDEDEDKDKDKIKDKNEESSQDIRSTSKKPITTARKQKTKRTTSTAEPKEAPSKRVKRESTPKLFY